MNEAQKDSLQILLNNEVMLGALQSVFTAAVENKRPLIGNEGDEVLGQKYRAYETARHILFEAFRLLETARREEKNEEMDERHI